MGDRITTEYQEFNKNRKRWKSEFGLASEKADNLMEHLKKLCDTCMGQN